MGLFENMRGEPVSRLNVRKAITVGPDASLRDAVLAMRDGGLGCAIVCEGNKPKGMFTEAILRQLVSANPPTNLDTPVADHMATTAWVSTDDTIETVLDALEANNTRFLCVVDEAGDVCGLTGQKGLMEYVAEHFPGEVMVQRIDTPANPGEREGA